jgi:phospholipase C
MSPLSRRRLLGTAVGVAGGAAAATLLPIEVQQAIAEPSPAGSSLRDVEHVVLIMQENRSFDHYFGTLRGVRGLNDPDALTLSTGRSVFHQPDPANPDGYLLPFHLDTRTTSAQAIPSTSHAWSVQHDAWHGGKMDNWLPAHRAVEPANAPYVMGYHTRADIPFQFALAESFTLCDNYFSSVLGPTWPNRMMWMTGTVDAGGTGGGPIISNKAPAGGYTWTTYAERLQAAGVSWQVYQQEDNYGCNMLENFAAFRAAEPGDPLYDRGVRKGPEGAFEAAARAGALPTVSWLIPTSTQSEHPDYLPAAGADWVASKLAAIASNRDLWRSTVVIINYDENDGLFDHVPPPTPPTGTAGEFVGGLPVGGGFRVPAIIVSPWTVGGWAATDPFDHTSCLRFLEHVTGVAEPNISAWRRATFGDFTSAFPFREGARRPPRLPDTKDELARAEWEVAHLPKPTLPGADQHPPRQEPGRRRQIPPRH